MIVKSVFVWLKAGAILAFLFIGIIGGGLTLWPFYTEHNVNSAEATSVINGIFQSMEGHDE
ncbi:hypothetical protein ACRN9J_18530 [Shewanella baltica]|uniref:hypothetical protein n=1 Tax=Shewanella baltica TaxID=62322 RepID=UPI0024B95690|nr:hypothetical protein [Shewanella baltica]